MYCYFCADEDREKIGSMTKGTFIVWKDDTDGHYKYQ